VRTVFEAMDCAQSGDPRPQRQRSSRSRSGFSRESATNINIIALGLWDSGALCGTARSNIPTVRMIDRSRTRDMRGLCRVHRPGRHSWWPGNCDV
jgi:hypothetical protein